MRVLAALAVLIVGCVPAPSVVAEPSPTPTAAPPTFAPTPSPSPSPTARPPYVNVDLGFAIELAPEWHRSICREDPDPRPGLPKSDSFTDTPAYDEGGTDTGTQDNRVDVVIDANPERMSAMQWASRPNMGTGPSATREETTFVGHPAVRMPQGAPFQLAFAYVLAVDDRIYVIGYRRALPPRPSDPVTMRRIVESFRFLTAAQTAAARAGASPSPSPRSRAQVTSTVAAAFGQKDVGMLASVSSACINIAIDGGGVGSMSRAKYLDELRARFAAGLTVTIDPATLANAGGPRSVWTEPSRPPTPYQLMIVERGGSYYWIGTLQLRD